ncbi:MAG: hypothetical protein ACJ712_03700 [Nitrososphaeraceae archaeon]
MSQKKESENHKEMRLVTKIQLQHLLKKQKKKNTMKKEMVEQQTR